MNLTEKQKTELISFSSTVGFTLMDICVVMGLDPKIAKEQLLETKSDFYLAYHTGKLKTKAELANKLKSLSLQGSGPALALSMKMHRETEYNNLLEHYGRTE